MEADQILCTKLLVEKGYFTNYQICNLLVRAARIGRLEMVEYLLGRLAIYVGLVDHILWEATAANQLEIVMYLVENYFKYHYLVFTEVLFVAAEKGYLEIVKYLIEKGANLHANDEKALKLSSQNGHYEIVKYLIDQGAMINV